MNHRRKELQIVFIVYAPTNKGLKYVRDQGLASIQAQYKASVFLKEARGEDIPQLTSNEKGLSLGITGNDLTENYGYAKPLQSLNLYRTGPYADTVFGLPALCVLGKGGLPPRTFAAQRLSVLQNGNKQDVLETIRELNGVAYPETPDLCGKRVAIPKRYENLIRSRVWCDWLVEWVVLDGKVDVTAATDSSIDYAIDIVLSGKTCESVGLGIYEIIYVSDGVLVSNQNLLNKQSTGGRR